MLNKISVLVQASSGMGVPLDDRVDIARLLDVTQSSDLFGSTAVRYFLQFFRHR